MIAEIGRFLIALAFLACVAQTLLAWRGADQGGRSGAARAGTAAAEIAVIAAGIAFLLLIISFVRSDFSIAYVASNSHVDKPLLYKISGAWGGHEGSMLLWCWILVLFGLGLARIGPKDPALRARSVSFQGLLSSLFFAFLAFASNPFERVLPAPIQGADLNPILQDPLLAIHPPMLYVGYVGLSAAFAIAAAGLMQKSGGRELASALRPWALGAWVSLTGGIALGAWWAYYELGWGGWWFWDPVENASFMPWLLGAALVHSAIATEKRGAFPGWTVFLALIAYILSILGAFLVRSGVLTSVHAFALDPERGAWILGMLGISAVAGFALFALRAGSLGEGDGFEPTSREAFIGVNNLLLAVTAGVVLIGTLYPLFCRPHGLADDLRRPAILQRLGHAPAHYGRSPDADGGVHALGQWRREAGPQTNARGHSAGPGSGRDHRLHRVRRAGSGRGRRRRGRLGAVRRSHGCGRALARRESTRRAPVSGGPGAGPCRGWLYRPGRRR